MSTKIKVTNTTNITFKEAVSETLRSQNTYIMVRFYDINNQTIKKPLQLECNLNIVKEDKIQNFKIVLMKSILTSHYNVLTSKIKKMETTLNSEDTTEEKKKLNKSQIESANDFLTELNDTIESIVLSEEEEELLADNGLISAFASYFTGTAFPIEWDGKEFDTIINTLNHIENKDKKADGKEYTLNDLRTNIAFFMKYVLNTGKNENEIIKGLNNIRMNIADYFYRVYFEGARYNTKTNQYVLKYANKKSIQKELFATIHMYLLGQIPKRQLETNINVSETAVITTTAAKNTTPTTEQPTAPKTNKDKNNTKDKNENKAKNEPKTTITDIEVTL